MSPTFRQPKALPLWMWPKCPCMRWLRKSKPGHSVIIKFPLTTKSAMKKTKDNDTLVFIVDVKANKPLGKQTGREFYVVMTTVKQAGGEKACVHLFLIMILWRLPTKLVPFKLDLADNSFLTVHFNYVFVLVCTCEQRCQQRPEEGTGFLKAGVTGGC